MYSYESSWSRVCNCDCMIACTSALQHENSVGIAAGSTSPGHVWPFPLFRVSHLRGKRTQVVLRDGGGCNDMDTGVTEGRESHVPWRPGLSRDEQGAGRLPSSSENAKEPSERRAVLSASFRTERTERAALLFSCPRQEFLAFLGVSTS